MIFFWVNLSDQAPYLHGSGCGSAFPHPGDDPCHCLVDQDKSCVVTDSDALKHTSKSKLLPFLSTHPLAETHGVRLLKRSHVPNFAGNTLPRHDQGDREYYCSTMLMLFKPWRSGLDLKTKLNSWDETFVSHGFSTRQL